MRQRQHRDLFIPSYLTQQQSIKQEIMIVFFGYLPGCLGPIAGLLIRSRIGCGNSLTGLIAVSIVGFVGPALIVGLTEHDHNKTLSTVKGTIYGAASGAAILVVLGLIVSNGLSNL
jgi:hypothetical protein